MDNEPWIDGKPPSDALVLARRGLYLALLPVVSFGACVVGNSMNAQHDTMVILAWTFLGATALGIVGGILGFISRRREKSAIANWAMFLGFVFPIFEILLGLYLIPVQRGRALRRRGKPRLPDNDNNDGWTSDPIRIGGDLPREQLADAWRTMAATETASIAAFASYANQLLALGAPSGLIEDAHRDALDEIRHARLCYGVATGFDGEVRGAAAFPAAVMPLDRTPTFESLALECLRESCVLEGASAYAAQHLAERAELSALRSVLDEIAVDEAVAKLAENIPKGVVDRDDWERFGVAGPTLWSTAVRQSLSNALARLELEVRSAA